MKRADYDTVRSAIQHGDVIAFGGEGLASAVIKLATNSPVSHVGVVYQTAVDSQQGLWQNKVIESTSLNGMSGVTFTRLSTRLMDYRGRVWWLPLSDAFRARVDWTSFHTWLKAQEGKPYATLGAIDSALDWGEKLPLIGGLFRNPDRYQRVFCSHLVCGAFKAAGALPAALNPAEMTPRDLTAMALYRDCVQLKGPDKGIKNFNRWPPEHFIG